MKKRVILLLALMAAMTTKAQTVGEITDSVKAGLKAGSVKDAVNTVKGAFEKKSAEASQMVGTWTFVEPAVMVTSGRLLAKAAGNLVDDKLEKLLDDYFKRSNVTPQNTSITFRKDGTFSRSVAGRKRQGVWMVGGEKIYFGVDNVQTAAMTTHMEKDTLTLVVEASRIMEAFKALGAISDSKSNNALIKLSKSLKGVEAGFVLARKKNIKK
ncbi:MAG: DUF4923 family protein [Prevotella sp.]|nr:DUF4923 family protein [Prevotella sp.]